jgi:glycosyltransferase involved in cell wall biosynthesis
MSHKPEVSIIMPVYNHQDYVKKSIQSLLDQTFQNWELIVIDDGSTDRSKEVILGFNDPRIQYHYQENLGVKKLAQTLNNGLAKAQAPLVTMLPSDDMWLPHKLEKQVPVFEDEKVVLCFGKMYLMNTQDEIVGFGKLPRHFEYVDNSPCGRIYYELLEWNFIFQPTVLIRKSALDAIGGYLQPAGLLAEDYPTHLELAKVGEFRFLDDFFANYRMHENQMSKKHIVEMHKSDLDFALKYFDQLPEEMKKNSKLTYEGLKEKLERRFYNNHFLFGRFALLNKEWAQSRRYFITAIVHGDLFSKIKSLLGFVFSLFKKDIEILAKFSKRAAQAK